MIILGIDPGTAIVGWAVIQKEKSNITLIQCDAILTSAKFSEAERLLQIYRQFETLLSTFKPTIVSVEQLYFATNAKTAISVAQSRGIIILACAQHNIPVVSYSPLQIKKTITGDGNADKKQIQFMLPRLISMKTVPKLDDITDAIAIALTHSYTHQF